MKALKVVQKILVPSWKWRNVLCVLRPKTLCYRGLCKKKKISNEVMSDHWQVQEHKKLDRGFASRTCVVCLTLKG